MRQTQQDQGTHSTKAWQPGTAGIASCLWILLISVSGAVAPAPRSLLVLANQSPEAVTYQIQYHPEMYREDARIVSVQEHLAGQRVRTTDRHIDLTLNAWAFRLVEVQLQ